MADYPPSCLDRADGSLGVGTATPSLARQSRPGGFFLEEDPNSPSIERGEQATIVHTFNCDESTGQTLIQGLSRGLIQTDNFGNVTRILSALLTRNRGDTWKLVVTSESLSFDNPPDDFEVSVMELNPAIEKHPNFATTDIGNPGLYVYNLNPTTLAQVDPAQFTGPQIIQQVRQSANSASVGQGAEQEAAWRDSTNVGDFDVSDQADVLLTLLKKGIENFYLAGWRITWSSYFYLPQALDGGGYVQDPVTQGGVPSYFWSTDQTPTGDNIFTVISAITNPAVYGGGLSWLRKADDMSYSRTWFKVSRTWEGGPLGHWESPLPYPPAP